MKLEYYIQQNYTMLLISYLIFFVFSNFIYNRVSYIKKWYGTYQQIKKGSLVFLSDQDFQHFP